jgi:hypothetical protein
LALCEDRLAELEPTAMAKYNQRRAEGISEADYRR